MGRIRTSATAVAAVAGMLVMASCGSSDDSSTGKKQPAYAATLQTQITQLMKDNVIPGATVLIRSRDQGDWSATFGTKVIGKRVPMSIDDYFRIGSNTKTMTSTVILQLVQEGKLKLDDPVSKFRPDVPNGANITIAQLSEMRSGLYSYSFDKGFNETLDREPQKVWTADELIAIALRYPPNFPPGTKFEYSNTNFILLGVIIEKLTGMSASEAFKKRIFEPLGLKHTLLPVPTDSSIPDPHPQGYAFGTNVSTIDTFALPPAERAAALDGSLQPTNYTNVNPSWAWTAGSAISTAGDLATYVKAMVGGGLLDANMQRIRLDSVQPIAPGAPVGYGLGLVGFAPNVYGHDGQLPGYMSVMSYDPKADNTIVVGTNLATVPAGEGAAVVLFKAILGTLYGAASVPGGDPAQAPTTTTPAGGSNRSTSTTR